MTAPKADPSTYTESELRENIPDTIPDDIEIFQREDDSIWGKDDYGEFRLNPLGGDDEPREKRCGAPLRLSMERYGEIRHCGRFASPDSYCPQHDKRKYMMNGPQELFKHGYFATNFINFATKLPPAKFLFAVEMVGGLFELSKHDFEIEHVDKEIDTEDSKLIEEDIVVVELPVPKNDTVTVQANELWTAALKEVMTQNMNEAIFSEGMTIDSTVATSDTEGHITDTITEPDEHPLHLPVSRVAKDIKEHLANGGVELEDDDGGVVTFQKNDYTLDVSPKETDSDDAQDHREAAGQFHEQLSDEDEFENVEIAESYE